MRLLGKWRRTGDYTPSRGFYLTAHIQEVMWALDLLFTIPFHGLLKYDSFGHALHSMMKIEDLSFEDFKKWCQLAALTHDLGKCGGDEEIEGTFAYGWNRPPLGRGRVYRTARIWASPSSKTLTNESARTYHVDLHVNPSYVILVDGLIEEILKRSLKGDLPLQSYPYLGESSDMVTWMNEVASYDHVAWVIPGTNMYLIVQSGRGFSHLSAKYQKFDIKVGKPHWFQI